MKKYINEDLVKIIISFILFIISFFFSSETIKLILIVVGYIIVAYEMYIEAFNDFKEGEIFNEELLMIFATLGAFYIHSYEEALMVILLFQLGEYLENLAVNKSKASITKLMDLRVDTVNIEDKGKVKLEEAKVGDIFIVKAGEKVPLDGVVVDGETYIDTSSLTGESVPRKVAKDENILSGCINKESLIKVQATTTSKDSTVQKIINLIENSNEKKSETETFIRKFAKIYTPIIVVSAFLLVLIPTLMGYNFNDWLYRALVFLVTSCPCALVISVPLGFYSGIGKASKEGILIKGSSELEKLLNIDYLLLDKTGTITEGVFEVTEINTEMDEDKFLNIVASVEENSNHPIATAIKNKNKEKLLEVKNHKEITGKGLSCTINNKEILVGNDKLLNENNISFDKVNKAGTVVYLSINNEYKGYLLVSDKIKETSKSLSEVKEVIKQEIIILSGDSKNIVESVSKEVGADKYYGELLPEDKVEYVEKYKKQGKVMFVGDGVNDAPVIKMSDVGVSMGGIGSDAAIEASDIVLMRDDLSKIKTAVNIAKVTDRKVKESIIFALVVKAIVLLLGIFGLSTIILAVFADVGVTLLVILNVITIFYKKIK
ncbi:MAG: heavy metal translocating P-type ATPase [Mollicutes bacterium]|nr:heavy metal translocating P-type ATPase [Mollicutes bacterium]